MVKNEILGSGDDSFKAVMLSKKGKKILEQIISQVLGKTVEIIEFINTELGKTQKVEKRKRVDVIVKMDGIIANVEVNTNDYNYVKFFRNFAYLVNLFNRYSVTEDENNEKIYDLKTEIIQINLNFGKVNTKETILINEFGNAKGMKIDTLKSYDIFMDNFEKFCYDNNEVEKYRYILMLNKTEEELASFYPEDEIIKEYGEALMKYSEKGFIYPYTHDEEQKMIHNTEKKLAYDEGVDAGIKEGIEQNKIEMIKNLKDKLSVEEIADVAKLSVERVKEIINSNN